MKFFLAGIFGFVYSIIMWLPISFLRFVLLKLTLKRLGKDSVVLRNVAIMKPRNVSIGNNVVVNQRVLLDGRGNGLFIGDHVDIAQECIIWSLTHDPNNNDHGTIKGTTIIEDYVWIGARATILSNVHIHKGAVIGTCSVVTKDIPENAIVAGIPAKIIGYRKNTLEYTLNYHPWFK
jgi:maltose O-acetyltransferase